MVVFWLVYGWVSGSLYRGFLAGSLSGMAFYPILFLSLLEAPRILYMTSGRVFAPLVFLAVFVLACRSHIVIAPLRPADGRTFAAPAWGNRR
jgi:hypothetical protein